MAEALRESLAKLHACGLVLRGAPGELRPATRARLLELVALAYRRPAFAVPFTLEAITYRAQRVAAGADLLAPCPGAELPLESLTLLHSGLGLGTAQAVFRGGGAAPATVAARVDRFLDEIAARALPEYAPIAIEALGLVLRTRFPSQLRAAIDRLAGVNPRGAELAAHGIGRALYFRPLRLLPWPGATWSALAQCRRELAEPELAIEAQKGVLFAQTFVTLHRPTVIEALLRRHRDEIAELPAWVPGFTAALLLRALTVPADSGPERFLDHRPAADVADAWRHLVAEPGRAWLGALRAEIATGRDSVVRKQERAALPQPAG